MREKIKIIAIFVAILLAGFLSFIHSPISVKAADTSNYCADDVRIADRALVDSVPQEKVTKGDSFVVLIQNMPNDYGVTYIIDILKQNQSVIQKTGSLEGKAGSSNSNWLSETISTDGFSAADYTVKVKLYHADLHCLVQMQELPLKVTETEDLGGVELLKQGDVAIGSPNKEIKAWGAWNAVLQNKSTADLRFFILVEDLETGEFHKKTSGTVKAGQTARGYATIVTPGKHTVRVEIKDISETNLLYKQNFNVTVIPPANGPVESVEPGGEKGPNGEIGKNSAGTGTTSGNGVGVGVPIPGKESDHYTYAEYLCAVYYWALNIGFGLTILMFMYAGYRYMTAAGNDAVFTDTKDIITSAILGFLLLLMIRLVLHVLNVPEPDKCFPSTTAAILNHLSSIRNSIL